MIVHVVWISLCCVLERKDDKIIFTGICIGEDKGACAWVRQVRNFIIGGINRVGVDAGEAGKRRTVLGCTEATMRSITSTQHYQQFILAARRNCVTERRAGSSIGIRMHGERKRIEDRGSRAR